jgi:flagellar biosynthesis chaperone FliJ
MIEANRWRGQLAHKLQQEQAVVLERAAEVDRSRDGVREAWRERHLMEEMHDRAATTEAEEEAMGERKANEAIALSVFSRRRERES